MLLQKWKTESVKPERIKQISSISTLGFEEILGNKKPSW
jgi:hypothetical protein